ncbi:DNA polymerase alpha/epsilon subunit B-domain-containing protein [Myxozyma melibiosi]|uniref:DNA polymerase alpha/epsilon subunit B-domain-containing protein n=1 Tax=Myxozyma melibiosi TaxID=54550 RepID=A0ABR1F9N4_9ASCO
MRSHFCRILNDEQYATYERQCDSCSLIDKYDKELRIDRKTVKYEQQFANLYFVRLSKLKKRVEKVASDAWDGISLWGQKAKQVDRVLDVKQGELSWVVGTVYMEMPQKPNILEEITKEFWTVAPISKDKIRDPEHDEITLEDDSGRLLLAGSVIKEQLIVTGCVIAVLGLETSTGEFEVRDIVLPGLAPQIPHQISTEGHKRRYIALVSGMEISGSVHEEYESTMLIEYLMGELGSDAKLAHGSEIVHAIFAGNSFADPSALETDDQDETLPPKQKKYGYDSSAYKAKPIETLDSVLAEISMSLSVDLMPGDHDPTNLSMPQQPIHPALLPNTRSFLGSSFRTVTNPCWWDMDGVRMLGTGGQNISDVFKYVEGDDRLKMMESTLLWQHCAPTAPDTLWSYPFQDKDPFILDECPHVYFAGNQPKFATSILTGADGQSVRIIAVPQFSVTKEIVLLDVDSLECEVVAFKAGAKHD